MKHCIWCRHSDEKVTFDKEAHTIPKSLGGKFLCVNVCDNCNAIFGNHYEKMPSVETIIKETFNISRARLLNSQNGIGKNKSMTKFSSIYFDVDFKKHKLDLKLAFRLQKGYQEKIGRQLKKGLYKIFLEELERQTSDGHNPQYDFIREFARYNLGDYPIFYFERRFGIVVMTDSEIFFEPERQMKYLIQEPGFFEFELLGHVFSLATSRHWELYFDNYMKKTHHEKKEFFKACKRVNYFNDIDLALSVLDQT